MSVCAGRDQWRQLRTKVSKKVAISVLFDRVQITLICGDDYAAQVLYDDLLERLQKGEGITLGLEQRQPDVL